MGKRGPAPTPTAKLKVTGSWRADARAKEGEPQPSSTPPKCPAWLPKQAKLEWRKLAPELSRLGLLTLVDEGALAGYCAAYAALRKAQETIDKDGEYLMVGGFYDEAAKEWRGGQTQPHPALVERRAQMKAVKDFSALFGLDPSSRTRLRVPGGAKPEEGTLKAFIGRKKEA